MVADKNRRRTRLVACKRLKSSVLSVGHYREQLIPVLSAMILRRVRMLGIVKFAMKAGCGLAGLAAAIMYSLYKEWMKSDLIKNLTPDQCFTLSLVSLAVFFLCFVIFVIAHLASNKAGSITATARNNSVAVVTTGSGNSTVTKN